MSRFGETVPYDATAVRAGWGTLPEAVRRRIVKELGSAPAEIRMAGGGFSGGFAARLRSETGTEVFVKAAGRDKSFALAACRQEARVNPALPEGIPAPRLEFAANFDDWTVLGFEAVPGRAPTLPMSPRDLDLMLDAWAEAAALLTPAPRSLLDVGVAAHPIGDRFRRFTGIASGAEEPFFVPPALEGRVDALAELECGIEDAMRADSVMHFDLRPDNMVLGADRAWICDWNWVQVHSTWFDTACFLVAAHGDGHDADALFRRHPTSAGVAGRQLDAVLASVTGYYLGESAQPPIADVSPYMRAHQRWSGLAAADWLARRRGWT